MSHAGVEAALDSHDLGATARVVAQGSRDRPPPIAARAAPTGSRSPPQPTSLCPAPSKHLGKLTSRSLADRGSLREAAWFPGLLVLLHIAPLAYFLRRLGTQ